MFYHLSLEHEILLHPRYFGPSLMDTVKQVNLDINSPSKKTSFSINCYFNIFQKLFSEVEGTCTGRHGFVVAVTTVDDVGAGLVQPGQARRSGCFIWEID